MKKICKKVLTMIFGPFEVAEPALNPRCLCPHRQLSIKLARLLTHPVIATLDHPLYAREEIVLFLKAFFHNLNIPMNLSECLYSFLVKYLS